MGGAEAVVGIDGDLYGYGLCGVGCWGWAIDSEGYMLGWVSLRS